MRPRRPAVAPEADVATTGVPTTVAVPPECVPPPAPAGVPTKDEALAKATDLLTALGVDTGSVAITANASEWSADVQAVPSLDGIATPSLTMSVGFGGEGKVQYTNGFLLSPEKADSYPRIGTTKAFDKLKAGKGMTGWFAYGGPMIRDSVASGVATTASGSETVCATDAPLTRRTRRRQCRCALPLPSRSAWPRRPRPRGSVTRASPRPTRRAGRWTAAAGPPPRFPMPLPPSSWSLFAPSPCPVRSRPRLQNR